MILIRSAPIAACRVVRRLRDAARVSIARALVGVAVLSAAAPGGAQVAIVLNSRDASVSLIDVATYKEVGRVDVGKEPHHLYPTPDGKSLIVANAISNDLHFLDPVSGRLQKRVRNIDDPYQIAFSPDRKWFVAVGLRLDRVDLYRADGPELAIAKRLPLGKAPSHVWFTSDGKFAFVTLQESNAIAAIDMQRQEVAWQMPVGPLPAGIVVSPDDRHLFVGVMGADYVEVVDWRARRSVAKIRTGNGAHNFRGLGDKRHLLVSNRVENTVSVIDMTTLKVVDTIPVPGGPDDIDVAADGKTLWITNRFARQVSMVDLPSRKVVRVIPVGRSPHGIYIHDRAPLL